MPATLDRYAIRHRVELETTPARAYVALTTAEGLGAWWTPMVEASPTVGAVLHFRFGDGVHGPDMRVEELQQDRRVAWRCIAGPWEGMTLSFALSEHPRGCALVFEHAGWTDQGDFFMHCNAKWGFFLAVSLKRFLETGHGVPHPQEPSI